MSDEQLIADGTLDAWQDIARCDDWHHRLVGSDIRMLIGDLRRARNRLAALADQRDERGGVGLRRALHTIADYDSVNDRPDYLKGAMRHMQAIARAALASSAPECGVGNGEWFYPEGDHSSDECRFSPDEVIEYALEGENVSRVVCIERAASLPTVYAAVRVWTDAEKDARGSDEDYDYTLFATHEEAQAALIGARPSPSRDRT